MLVNNRVNRPSNLIIIADKWDNATDQLETASRISSNKEWPLAPKEVKGMHGIPMRIATATFNC